jgi:hypothetical protein
MDVKPLDLNLGGNAQAVDEVLILWRVGFCTEMLLNHVEKPNSLGRDQHSAEGAIEVHAPMLLGKWAGAYCVLVHFAMKFAKALDLITVCGTYVMSSSMRSRAHMVILPVVRQFPILIGAHKTSISCVNMSSKCIN